MKQTIFRLLDASGLAALAFVANDLGWIGDGAVLVAVGISVGLAIAIIGRALRDQFIRHGRVIEVDAEAGIALIEFRHQGRTSRRWLPISEVIGSLGAPGAR